LSKDDRVPAEALPPPALAGTTRLSTDGLLSAAKLFTIGAVGEEGLAGAFQRR
jgi:hypothetical protein